MKMNSTMKVYKVTNRYGKTLYFNQPPFDVDNYHLDESLYFISEVYIPTIFFHDYIFKIRNTFTNSLVLYHPSFEAIEEEDMFLELTKYPLELFYRNDLLKNHTLLYQFIDAYPHSLFTLMREEYNKYISVYELVSLLAQYQIYPVKCLYPELFHLIISKDQTIAIQVYCTHFLVECFFELCKLSWVFPEYYDTPHSSIFKTYSDSFFLLDNISIILKNLSCEMIDNIINDKRFSDNMYNIEHIIYYSIKYIFDYEDWYEKPIYKLYDICSNETYYNLKLYENEYKQKQD